MGFRSTLTSECLSGVVVPDWFVEKYPYLSFMRKEGTVRLSFSIVEERKFYSVFSETELFLDVQKLLVELDVKDIVLVLLHECGGISRVQITKTEIKGNEPTGWKEVECIEHDYCDGCSGI